MRGSLIFLLLFLIAIGLSGQKAIPETGVVVKHITEPITLDGKLEEAAWSQAHPASNFFQYFPTDTVYSNAKTQIFLMSDEKNLYVGIRCTSAGDNWIVPSLRRDFRAGGNDNITLVFDTFNDKTNAMFFGINPEGVIREGLVSNGGNQRSDFSESWDNVWAGKSSKYVGGYTAELVIPFSTLRYNAGNDQWGMLAYRFDTQENEWCTWPRIPQNQILFNLAYVGEMKWEKAPPPTKSNISLIPFVTAGGNKDFESGEPGNSFFDFGGDAKIAISAGLNLDITVNPDFSQVEVDRQITNLDRFEIFFPERRQFFLENADLFGQFGFETINPFFSRRIGVGIDTSTGVNVQNRIYGGARLSGKIDQNTRIGLLNMQAAANEGQGLPSKNYSVVALQRKVLSRSNIGFIGVNKQSFGDNVEDLDLSKYNRVAGFDFNYANSDNTWSGKTFTHASFTSNGPTDIAHGTRINHNKREYGGFTELSYVGADYNAETGFVRRRNYVQSTTLAELRFYPTQGSINTISPGVFADVLWRPGFGKTDHDYIIGVDGQFRNNARFELRVVNSFVHLFDDFDPTGTDSTPLPGDTDYNWWSVTGSISSDFRQPWSTRFSPYVGQYFNGSRYGTRGSVTYRYEPRGTVQINYAINVFDMPHIEDNQMTLLIGPRIDYTLSKSLFTTLFVQYNSQSQNTNVNARLQWRFAPVSDFFLVFTDNYLTGNVTSPRDRFAFDVRNRSLVAKLTYWFNT